MDFSRREFLKAAGTVGTTTFIGSKTRHWSELASYVVPPEDLKPGEGIWYATTCRECPAGCGMHVKNRDGRVVKAEGNPHNPISFGNLCPRGQASLQGLYNPDRLPCPIERTGAGRSRPLPWKGAEKILHDRLSEIHTKGRGSKIVLVTELITGALSDLAGTFMELLGGSHIRYEPYAYEALRTANDIVFQQNAIPNYRIDKADFLLSFNAGFLETWISNVEFAHYFKIFREPDVNGHGLYPFVFIGPRNSLTAANADKWVKVKPGDEYLVALGMLKTILDESLAPDMPASLKGPLEKSLSGFSMEKISGISGIDSRTISDLARKFAAARHPLALAEGQPYGSPNALETAVAVNLLCSLVPGTLELLDFESRSALSDTARVSDMKNLSDRMESGDVDLLLVHYANPAFTLPGSWQFVRKLSKVPTIVSFSSWRDETSLHAHLMMPSNTHLESWGDYTPRANVRELMQPAMGTVFKTRLLGDILLSAAKKFDKDQKLKAADFHQMLQDSWRSEWEASGKSKSFEYFWLESVQRGGRWQENEKKAKPPSVSFTGFSFPAPASSTAKEGELLFTTYPTIQFFDGRMANRPWLQELADPISQTTWGAWAEIHPETAKKMRISKSDMLRINSGSGEIEVPALPIFSVPPGIIAVPIGQGHTSYGRYASGLPANPMEFMPGGIDKRTGGLHRPHLQVSVKKTGKAFIIANTDGNFYQLGRGLIQSRSIEDYRRAKKRGEKPAVDFPMPRGYKMSEDFYPTRYPIEYRWAMALDLHRCIGCGACSVACYAENNLAIVGRERVIKGLEMSWLTVQRYFNEKNTDKIEWLVMLCQQCTEAPCEAVCPVFAPQHSIEGLNTQIYNRCIGTRDCSQNDPWKVRRFNFAYYTHPFPLNWQLNPDVTVRQVGVMEKCSFCVQRIIHAKAVAHNEGRKVRDGEFTTACAQTCPTNALIFGSLLDPNSRVSKLIKDPRAYQTLRYLNTKPGAIYLTRITQEV